MVTVLRAHGFRVVIFVDDHVPAHVFGNGQAKINLLGADGIPDLIWTEDMTGGDVRRAMRIVIERQALLLARWKDIHGPIN